MENKKLKILNFNSGFVPDKGGVATYSWELTRHLAKSDDVEHVQVIAFNISDIQKKQELEKVNHKYSILRIKRGTTNFLTMGLKILRCILKYKEYQIVHATNFFPVGLWCMIWTKLLNKKYFITIYGTDTLTDLGSKKTKWLKKIIMKKSAKIFSISHSTTNKTIEKYNLAKEKFATIHPGVTKDFNEKINPNLKQELDYNQDDFIVLSVCHLVKRKGIDDIIRAIAKIPDDKIKLLVVGKGPEKENLEKLAHELNISQRVKLTSKVPEIESYYNLGNILILASYWDKTGDIEGFGLVLGEAQLRGVPTIGTNSGGIPETTDNDVTGFIVPERAVDKISEKVLLLKNNKELYQRMSKAGPKFIQENFNWINKAKEHIDIYKKYT